MDGIPRETTPSDGTRTAAEPFQRTPPSSVARDVTVALDPAGSPVIIVDTGASATATAGETRIVAWTAVDELEQPATPATAMAAAGAAPTALAPTRERVLLPNEASAPAGLSGRRDIA
nr:hypothetical protein [Leekyejoonella antrihumi]